VLDGEITNDDSVLGNVTLEGTGSVSDGEFGTVGLVGRGLRVVVLAV
jgi:hypothetical protein